MLQTVSMTWHAVGFLTRNSSAPRKTVGLSAQAAAQRAPEMVKSQRHLIYRNLDTF